MTGRRLPDGSIYGVTFAPGDYMRDQTGVWWVKPPRGRLGSLHDHTVIEHDDGTVTVSPSILLEPGANPDKHPGWHGYLEQGVWREA